MADENVPVPPKSDMPATPLPSDTSAQSASRVIYQGSVSLWLGFKVFFWGGFWLLIGFAALVFGSVNSNQWYGTAALIGGAALLLATVAMVGYTVLSLRAIRYTITNRLIEREQGLIVRRVDALDLSRVKDVQLAQSLLQRIQKIGTIEVYSSDATDPVLLLEAIPNPRPIYEQLRDAVLEVSRRRGIVSMG